MPTPIAVKNYFVTLNGVTILCDAKSLVGWVDFVLAQGKTPMIEKMEMA